MPSVDKEQKQYYKSRIRSVIASANVRHEVVKTIVMSCPGCGSRAISGTSRAAFSLQARAITARNRARSNPIGVIKGGLKQGGLVRRLWQIWIWLVLDGSVGVILRYECDDQIVARAARSTRSPHI